MCSFGNTQCPPLAGASIVPEAATSDTPMLDWLYRPTCPCDPAAKVWVEKRLAWLAEEFEDSAFSGHPVFPPTPQFFPDPFDGSANSIRTMLDRVCGYMKVDRDIVQLKFNDDVGKVWLVNDSGQYLPSGLAGTYSQDEELVLIKLDVAGMDNLVGLVGTMAHELAHSRLMGEGRVSCKEFDNELLTDLTVVHFGLGVFLANSPRAWQSTLTGWPGSELRRPEYMSSPMDGWALAHLALFRGETKPPWARYLSLSALANLKQGIRYLITTADTAYRL
jgi:hypothetical protein